MDTRNQSRNPLPIDRLAADLTGDILTAGDEGYDQARTPFYGGFDAHPGIVVRPAHSEDVVRVVDFAAEHEVELAVRGGGHSLAGHSVTDGGILLDLSPLKQFEIDLEERVAWAGGGLTAGSYTEGAGRHGLATGFGDTGSVGIGGITLGGGIGFLSRRHGLTIDSLLGAELVTADGQTRPVDEENHPDLFWAIRGGGGNFGVATRFRYRLHPVDRVVGGLLVLPATVEVVTGLLEAAEEAPRELTVIANVMVAPPMPFLPEAAHGRLAVVAILTYAGPVEKGERAVAAFRSLAPPLADLVEVRPYPDMYLPEEEGFHPVMTARTMFVDSVEARAVEVALEQIGASTAAMAAIQLRVLGGAIRDVTDEATAFAHRQRRLMVNVAAMYERPEEGEVHAPWVENLAAAISPEDLGAYVGFLGADGRERIGSAYPPATLQRLAEIKARYDPSNLFRRNHNVEPASRRATA